MRSFGATGIGERGHITRAAAIEAARLHYAQMFAEATVALQAIADGRVRVFHQRGIEVPRNRKEVTE